MRRFRSGKAPKKHAAGDFDGVGLQFPGKFLGRVPVSERKGNTATQQAIRLGKANVKSGLYNPMKKKVKCFIKISTEGLSTVDLKTNRQITRNPVHRITAWYPDDTATDTFGVVVKGEGGISGESGEYGCIVLKSPKAKGAINALMQLHEIVFEPEFEEVKEPPAPPAAALKSIAAANMDDADTWKCAECTFPNGGAAIECTMCSAPKPTGELADEGEEEELIDPYGSVPGADCDADGEAEPEEFIPAFEATHNEEIAPDYMNIFENAEIAGGGAATPTASPDASFTGTEDGGCTDYMNLPNSAAQTAAFAEDEESSNYMNLPDEHVRPAGRTNSLSTHDAPRDWDNPPAMGRSLSWSNPFSRRNSASMRSAKNPFSTANAGSGTDDDESSDDGEVVATIDFKTLFNKS